MRTYGRTHLLKNLIINNLSFDNLRLIDRTLDQNGDIESVERKADVEIMKKKRI